MEYSPLIRSIKKKLNRFSIIIQDTPISVKEYDMLLESYACDICEMCKRFYEERGVSE